MTSFRTFKYICLFAVLGAFSASVLAPYSMESSKSRSFEQVASRDFPERSEESDPQSAESESEHTEIESDFHFLTFWQNSSALILLKFTVYLSSELGFASRVQLPAFKPPRV